MLSVTLQQKHNPALHSWNAPPCFWICTQEPGVLSKQETGISDKTFLQMKRRAKIHPPHKHTLTDGTFPLNGFVTYSEKTKPGVGGGGKKNIYLLLLQTTKTCCCPDQQLGTGSSSVAAGDRNKHRQGSTDFSCF